jgi:hypothetical protein
VVYLLVAGPPDLRVELHLRLDAAAPALPSLADLSYPASRFEREMHDLYGITPTGHPQPRRLLRHPHWPHGWYPMRASAAAAPPPFGQPEGPFPFLTVKGPGVYHGVGIVEGWRGAITHRVELDTEPRLTRVKIVDPSFFNWPAPPAAMTGTIVPDFPLANKSFNLSYAGNDL